MFVLKLSKILGSTAFFYATGMDLDGSLGLWDLTGASGNPGEHREHDSSTQTESNMGSSCC